MKKSTKYFLIIAACLFVIIIISSADVWINELVQFIIDNWKLILALAVIFALYMIKDVHEPKSELHAKDRYEQTRKLDNKLNNSKN